MSTIRLEHDKFSAAPMLVELLNDRLLSVSEAGNPPHMYVVLLLKRRLVARMLLLHAGALPVPVE
jgi:hypothetical protein